MPEQAQRLKELSDELGSLFDTYEKSSPPHDELEQVQKATQGLMEEVNYFLNVSENVSESADHHIEEKIVKTVIGVVLKDLVPKVEVALKRELDKLANILVDEVRPVLENDPESSGSVDQAVLEMRSDIGAISKEIYQGAAATVEHALNVAMNNVVRQKALAGYLSMVRVATEAAGSKLETRVKSVVTELETIVGTPTSKDASVPSQHAGAPGSHSGHNVGVSHSPAPQPRPVHPAVTPVQDAGVSRSPPPPPGPAHPPVSAKTGHDELSDDNPPTSPNRAISDRSGALMADLNRILAGPPKNTCTKLKIIKLSQSLSLPLVLRLLESSPRFQNLKLWMRVDWTHLHRIHFLRNPRHRKI
ncbi:hypothetical protein BJ742DRAFT_245404 [Cladochytrium replicatum]|nr:hypothetical protein BJ742DRAFT_245404 [Cladochytrium replicatum]